MYTTGQIVNILWIKITIMILVYFYTKKKILVCCRFIGLFYLLGAEMSRKSFITDPIELVFIVVSVYVICKATGQLYR